MTPKVLLHPAAEEELAAAVDWYSQRSQHAADLFVEEISSAVEQVRKSAAQFPPFTAGTRRALLGRFPYFLVFREIQDGTQILAVAHAKRRPGYWRRRIAGE